MCLVASSTNPTDLASLFECPVCFDYALPPIMQCQSGHIVCSACRPKLQFCPTCRGTLGTFRTICHFCLLEVFIKIWGTCFAVHANNCFSIVIPAKARDYVFTGVGLSVCLFVCLSVCLLP